MKKKKKTKKKHGVRLPARKRWEQTKTFYHEYGLVNVVFSEKILRKVQKCLASEASNAESEAYYLYLPGDIS